MHVYKRTGDHLKQAASNVIASVGVSKKVEIEETDVKTVKKQSSQKVEDNGKELIYGQMLENVLKTRGELRMRRSATCKVQARQLFTRAKKVTIDVNLNMNVSKK